MTRALLPIAAVLVLGMGLYLFVEVRAAPAPAEPVMGHVSPSPAPAAPQAAHADEPAAHVPQPAARRTPSPPSSAAPGVEPAVAPSLPTEPAPTGDKLVDAMAEANRAYDRGDFDEAKAAALRLLQNDPTNVRMLRVVVSASCFDGDAAGAQASYAKLPIDDQQQMKTRCARYGINFPDKP